MAASISNGSIWPAAAIASPRFVQEMRDPVSGESSMRWLLRHNQSITPGQAMFVYAALATVSLGIAAGFWATGATLVLPFVGVELLALGVAMLIHARHATDCEEIRLQHQGLSVTCSHGGRVERVDFQPEWVRVEPERHDRSLIELSGQGRRVVVGRFVRPERRRQLAEEIRWALRRWHPGGA